MPAPATVQEFIALLRQSRLLDEETVDRFVQQRRTAIATNQVTMAQLAGLLVRDGLLTHFQAESILHGRWRRFNIGRYRVLDQLGTGGMGSVLLCEHTHMRRKVAVKILPIAQTANSSSLERFYREARAVAVLNHPNVVRAYDVGQDDSLHFFAMEYVEGSTLHDIVRKTGLLSPLQAVHYLRQAAAGLHHIHQNNLVHRDIKPANLLVDLTGTVKILDLGLARFHLDNNDDLTIRQNELVLGTVDFLSPEQGINSHEADIRSDIYSLGATIYFCLTGSPPLGHGSMAQKLLWLQTRDPQPITELRPDVPPSLAALLDKMMARLPEDRFQSPQALQRAVESLPLLTGETATSCGDATLTKPDQWGRKPSDVYRWLRVGAGVALVFLIAGWMMLVAASANKQRAPEPNPPATVPKP